MGARAGRFIAGMLQLSTRMAPDDSIIHVVFCVKKKKLIQWLKREKTSVIQAQFQYDALDLYGTKFMVCIFTPSELFLIVYRSSPWEAMKDIQELLRSQQSGKGIFYTGPVLEVQNFNLSKPERGRC